MYNSSPYLLGHSYNGAMAVTAAATVGLCWRYMAIKLIRYDFELHLDFLLGSISHPFYSRLRCDTAEMAATAGLLLAPMS